MKKRILINSIFIFIISALYHSIYQFIPNTFTALLFPVNESIGEHNKMIIMAFLTWAIIEKFILKRKNTFIYGIISALVCIFIELLVFSPIYFYILDTVDNIAVTLIIYFIAILISQILNVSLDKNKLFDGKDKLSLFIWLLVIIINGILTFYPPKVGLYYDYNNLTYGISEN